MFDGLCGLTHLSHGLRAFCFYIILGFPGVFTFLPTNTSPTPLTLTTMFSSSMAPVPAASSSSENLCNIKGLSPWESLQNHYLCLGSVDRADYFPSVSHFLSIFHALLSLSCFSPFRLLLWLLVLTLCVRIPLLLIMM